MKTTLDIIQLVSSVLIVITILLQRRGSGLSATFGGGEGNFYHAKRGFEKALLIITIILAIVFLGTALLRITV
ncbi:preprotein translocase subunit SecG [bacterium]|nr:MAG: preprotein translocase subunit SecG [bacterium]